MPLIGDLTRPENSAELRGGRRTAEKIKAAGGCPYCIHRDRSVMAWGRSVCFKAGRVFPQCVGSQQYPAFEIDEQQLRDTP